MKFVGYGIRLVMWTLRERKDMRELLYGYFMKSF